MKRAKRRPDGRKTALIGIIAEDASDVAVLEALINNITRAPFAVRSVVANGCGRIVGKCRVWAENLFDRGCRYLLLVHDLDTQGLSDLETKLARALRPSPIEWHLIVIPVREIEAWLLADHLAIRNAMNLRRELRMVPNPETIERPKEHLRDLIYRMSNNERHYINTIDNPKIAEQCEINNLRRCNSFVPFVEFINTHI